MSRPTAYKSKADFVRAQPSSMPASDVIAAGKAAGLKITQADVHATRSNDRAKKKRATPKRKPKKTPTRAVLSRESLAADDTLAALRKLALRIGVRPLRKMVEALEREAGL